MNDITDLREVLARATGGTWRPHRAVFSGWRIVADLSGSTFGGRSDTVCEMATGHGERAERDAVAITAAVRAVPELLDALDLARDTAAALEAENTALTAVLRHYATTGVDDWGSLAAEVLAAVEPGAPDGALAAVAARLAAEPPAPDSRTRT